MTPDLFVDLLATATPASPSASVEPAVLLRFAGRLHPAVVHFPIGLLITAGVVEVVRRVRGAPGISPVSYTCVVIGALAAALAAWLGWVNADVEPQARAATGTLFWHRWIGVSVAGAALLAACAGLLARAADWSWLRNTYRGALLLSALLVAVGGYLGGELVHGSGHLLEVFRAPPVDPAPDDAPAAAPPPVVTAANGAPPTGHLAVQAIFNARCVECHGPKKQKAMLRLDAPEHYVGGDPAFAVIAPGDAAGSVVFERISLPAGHLDLMPKGGDRMPKAEIATVRAWIEAGAPVTEAKPADDGAVEAPAAAKKTSPGKAGAAAGVSTRPPADSASNAASESSTEPAASPAADPLGVKGSDAAAVERALAALRGRGAVAGRVAADTKAIDVNLSVLGRNAADTDLALLTGLESSLTWLNLARTSITDDGLARLVPFTALKRLRLEQCPVGDTGIAHLTGLARLEYLNLYGTEITDEGLAQLTTLPSLRQLYLWDTRVTDEGVAGARAVRPDLEIVRGAAAPVEVGDGGTGDEALPPCCASARAAGGACDHECCVAAAKEGRICAKCASASK